MPERYWWWWRASRVITDYSLANVHIEIIDEFPFFSYLLGDLHPHVLAMPFGLLAVGVALNLFLGGWKGETNLGFYRLPVRPMGLFFGALVLGGLAFLNTWDILVGFALLVGAYALVRALESGWAWKRLEDVFALGVPLGLLAILLYLPFYVGFSSQAGGILPNLENPTRGVQLWVMFGPLFLAIFAYLVYLWRARKASRKMEARFWPGSNSGVTPVDFLLAAWFAGKTKDARFRDRLSGQHGLPERSAVFLSGYPPPSLIYRRPVDAACPARRSAGISFKGGKKRAED